MIKCSSNEDMENWIHLHSAVRSANNKFLESHLVKALKMFIYFDTIIKCLKIYLKEILTDICNIYLLRGL